MIDIKLTTPFISDDEIEGVKRVLDSGNLTQGVIAEEFSKQIMNYVGMQFGVPVSSCTTALHLALVAIGISPGDEILLPDFTFPATINAVIQSGATPILVDISNETYNIDTNLIDDFITEKTKAIIPVHAFGLMAQMDKITEIATKKGILIIEDAACALGSRIGDRHAGTFGDLSCFSFHPRKIITTGEGGIVLTNNNEFHEKMSVLSKHGGNRTELYFEFLEPGFNYRMSDVHAAIGIAQMLKLERILKAREKVSKLYHSELAEIEEIVLPLTPKGYFHSYQSYVIQVSSKIDRDFIIRFLRENGIESTLGYYSLVSQPYLREKFDKSRYPKSIEAFNKTISIPISYYTSERDIYKVAQTLKRAINANNR